MKLSTNLKALTAAAVLAVPALAPTAANAELGYNAAVSSMYLWRGQDVSQGPAMSGGIDYSHESGAYASIWASSGFTGDPAVGGGYEFDAWVGYATEVSGVGIDISYWGIEYPQAVPATDVINEVALGLSYDMFSLGFVSGDGYTYTTLGAEFGKFSVTIGMSSNDDSTLDYNHYDVSYAATDSLTFTFSESDVDFAPGLFVVSYSLPVGK